MRMLSREVGKHVIPGGGEEAGREEGEEEG
jgi:hypothetical protein